MKRVKLTLKLKITKEDEEQVPQHQNIVIPRDRDNVIEDGLRCPLRVNAEHLPTPRTRPEPNFSNPGTARNHSCRPLGGTKFSSEKAPFGDMRQHNEHPRRRTQPPEQLAHPGSESGSGPGSGQPVQVKRKAEGKKKKESEIRRAEAKAKALGFTEDETRTALSWNFNEHEIEAASGLLLLQITNGGVDKDDGAKMKEKIDDNDKYRLHHSFERLNLNNSDSDPNSFDPNQCRLGSTSNNPDYCAGSTSNLNNSNPDSSPSPWHSEKVIIKRKKDDSVPDNCYKRRQKKKKGNSMEAAIEVVDDSEKWKCSTCDKAFLTHQALGGHMTSHRKGLDSRPPGNNVGSESGQNGVQTSGRDAEIIELDPRPES